MLNDRSQNQREPRAGGRPLNRRFVVSLVTGLALAVGIVGCGGGSAATKTTTTTRRSSLALDLKGGVELIFKCRRPASKACHNEVAKLRRAEAAVRSGG
jgi:hypothetical protein